MNDEPNLYLVLGCWGRNDDGFISCSSVSNPILRIHPGLEDYDLLIKYLSSCQLTSRKVTDYNAVRNILFRIQNKFMQGPKFLWSEKQFRLMENFTIQHRPCGLYLALEFFSPSELANSNNERSVVIDAKR